MKSVAAVILLFMFAYLLGHYLQTEESVNDLPAFKTVSTCDLLTQDCEVQNNKLRFNLGFESQPSALKPFLVAADLYGFTAESVTIEFKMKDMEMGFNQHKFKKVGKQWQADVILPVCSLGRNDWIVEFTVLTEKSAYTTMFEFEQVSLK